MKKRNDLIKTMQLVLFILFTVAALIIVLTDKQLYNMIGQNASVRRLSLLMWLILLSSFLFILRDFRVYSNLKKEYKELDYALRNDRVAGIANRFSCDAMIEKYADAVLPDNIGSIMLSLTNIREINEEHGHAAGNRAIQEFSAMLLTSSVSLCFVGRNGGNKFLALFENGTESQMATFLQRVDGKVNLHNRTEGAVKLEYSFGSAFQLRDKTASITKLIALSDSRISGGNAK